LKGHRTVRPFDSRVRSFFFIFTRSLVLLATVSIDIGRMSMVSQSHDDCSGFVLSS
jgi:hypothetical protein